MPRCWNRIESQRKQKQWPKNNITRTAKRRGDDNTALICLLNKTIRQCVSFLNHALSYNTLNDRFFLAMESSFLLYMNEIMHIWYISVAFSNLSFFYWNNLFDTRILFFFLVSLKTLFKSKCTNSWMFNSCKLVLSVVIRTYQVLRLAYMTPHLM